jgi:HK97 family phage portal protein
MYVLRSSDIRVQLDTSGYVEYYEHQNTRIGATERYMRDSKGQYKSLDGQRELIHFSSLIIDPDSTDQGAISDLAALRNEFEQYITVTTHNISLLNNGGRPSGALKVPSEAGNLDPKARAELQAQIASTFAGAQNAGRPMLLEGGLDWVNFATSPKDGDFNTTKNDAEAQIFKAVGVPLDLAGNSKAVSANNMVNIRREFYKSRVVPLMVEMLEFFNNFLLPRYGSKNLELRVDYSKIDVFIEERMDMMKLIETSTSRTPNEKRKAQGLPADLEGGDNLYDPNGRFIAGPDADKFMNSTRMINTPSVATP